MISDGFHIALTDGEIARITFDDIINGHVPENAARTDEGNFVIVGASWWSSHWKGERFIPEGYLQAVQAVHNAKVEAIRASLAEQMGGDPAHGDDVDRKAFYAALDKRTRWIRVNEAEVRAHLQAQQPTPPTAPAPSPADFAPEVPQGYPVSLPFPPQDTTATHWLNGKGWLNLETEALPDDAIRVPALRWDTRRQLWERFWLYATAVQQDPQGEPGALHIDAARKLTLEIDDLIGVSAAVLGIRGSGKTNTTAVLIEELLAGGVPMTIVDVEGEYWGLKERFDILVVGHSENADLEVDWERADALADFSVRQGVPVILDLDDFNRAEMFEFLTEYFRGLWSAAKQERVPYHLVIEEAHEFAPQGRRTPLSDPLARIALRGRKRGLGTVIVSQRSSRVDKDLLTQASVLFLHQVVHPSDLEVYKDLIPLKRTEINRQVPALEPGQAVALINHEPRVVRVRKRHTFHAGATPGLDASTPPALRKIDAALLAELRRCVGLEREAV